MDRFPRPLTALLVGVLLVPGSGARAQGNAPPGSKTLINLKFPGGTLDEYVTAVRQAAGGVNIVVMPGARDIEMPAVELESVVIATALNLLEGEMRPDERTIISVGVEEFGPWEDHDTPIYRITAEVHRRGRGPVPAPEARVWAVNHLLSAGLEPEAVLTAVETTVGLLAEEHEPAQIRFHEATGLLIARGHPAQMDAIEQVVDRLDENIERQREGERREGEAESIAGLFEWIEEMKRLDNEGHADAAQRAREHAEQLEGLMHQKGREAEELTREMDALRERLHHQESVIRELRDRLGDAEHR